MELKAFVAETLSQVILGVREAQVFASTHEAKVVPPRIGFRPDQGHVVFWELDNQSLVQVIEFDVAVTTTEGTTAKGGVGVFVGAVGVGTQGQSTASSQSVTRIKFSVPVGFPKQS